LGGGFIDPHGVAVDGGGNVFVADIYNNSLLSG
jgi:DNA-binding beta-propeller fold protein YncE